MGLYQKRVDKNAVFACPSCCTQMHLFFAATNLSYLETEVASLRMLNLFPVEGSKVIEKQSPIHGITASPCGTSQIKSDEGQNQLSEESQKNQSQGQSIEGSQSEARTSLEIGGEISMEEDFDPHLFGKLRK